MNKLSKFYKDVLATFDIKTDDEGMIYINIGGVNKPLESNGIPWYLPTDNNVNTMTTLVNGSPTITKGIFNPLDENEIKGANNSFNKLKTIIELKITGVVSQLGLELLKIASDKDSDINNIELVKFINTLNTVKTREKRLVDDKSISNWGSLYSGILTKELKYKYARLFIKSGGTLDNISYNRIGTITFPFLEGLRKAGETKDPFLDVKLRRKDFDVYESMLRYMFKHFEPDGINQYGSLNRKSPSMHILLLMYSSIYDRLIDAIDAIKSLDIDSDELHRLELRKLPIKIESFTDFISDLENEIRRVPHEGVTAPVTNNTAARPAATATSTGKTGGSFWDKVKSKNQANGQVTQVQQQPAYQQPVQQPQVYQQQPAYQQPVQQQPMQQARVVQQQPAYQQPVQQQARVMQRQPAYQQPVQQQPVYQQPVQSAAVANGWGNTQVAVQQQQPQSFRNRNGW